MISVAVPAVIAPCLNAICERVVKHPKQAGRQSPPYYSRAIPEATGQLPDGHQSERNRSGSVPVRNALSTTSPFSSMPIAPDGAHASHAEFACDRKVSDRRWRSPLRPSPPADGFASGAGLLFLLSGDRSTRDWHSIHRKSHHAPDERVSHEIAAAYRISGSRVVGARHHLIGHGGAEADEHG